MIKRMLHGLFLVVLFFSAAPVSGNDRAAALKEEMWNSSDKDFGVVAVPAKWKNESAVIISQLHRFEYRKALIASLLRINQYSHYRIKLIDKNAINKYAEISYVDDQPGPNTGTGLKVYAGFKIIKPDGREIVVDLAGAVKMERDGSNGNLAYKKIAIPNLEPGDILDYYICEENVILRTSQIQFFDPVIYNLPQEYPVIKQKLQFKVERRCYINLRSLNGAPELKLMTDEENDEQYYSLEDGDRDGISDIRWLYPNRELPTIKFRASYASGAGIRSLDVLLGKQGEVKSKVTGEEIVDLTKSLTSLVQYTKDASKYIKSNHKDAKDPASISYAAYYYYRNQMLTAAEASVLDGEGLSSYNALRFTDKFSDFLTSKKIPHDIVVGVDRHISGLDDIVIENELKYLVRVKDGSKYLYFSPIDVFVNPNMIFPRLQGTDAYAMDGLASRRVAKRITLPASTRDDNTTETMLLVRTTDMSSAELSATHTLRGINKLYGQYEFLDVYDAIEEDNSKFEKLESFRGYSASARKKYQALKDAYMASRGTNRSESVKKSIEANYDFKIKDVVNFRIIQTGRFDDQPAMIYSVDFKAEDLIKKAGPNYLVDVGKLIERQVQVEADEMERDFGIYFDHPRSFRYKIVFEIPNGYEVQGIDKLNSRVENNAGGFVSTAQMEGRNLVIETQKHYNHTALPKDEWKSVVAFLNAASAFSVQKILLRKVK